MEDKRQVENDRQRAEVFDALGHPTRILILKALSEEPLGFADLKKKTGIESSGHLQHHLTKLNSLIRTDEYGKYCLSDQGKDALLTVQTVEKANPKTNVNEKAHNRHFNTKTGLKPIVVMLVALLIASSTVALFEYSQTVNSSFVSKEVTIGNFVQSGFTGSYKAYYTNITDGQTVIGTIFFSISSAPANSSSADQHQVTCQLIAKQNYQVDSVELIFSSEPNVLAITAQPLPYGYPQVNFYSNNMDVIFSVKSINSFFGETTQNFVFNLSAGQQVKQLNIETDLSMHQTTSHQPTEFKSQAFLGALIP